MTTSFVRRGHQVISPLPWLPDVGPIWGGVAKRRCFPSDANPDVFERMDDLPIYMKVVNIPYRGLIFFGVTVYVLWKEDLKEKKLAWWTINLLVRLLLKTPVSGKRIAWEVMFRRYDSEYDSPDASKHGFKTMGMISGYIRGMIRGYDSGHDAGYDSRQCNMPVVIDSVYAILANYRIFYAAAMFFK